MNLDCTSQEDLYIVVFLQSFNEQYYYLDILLEHVTKSFNGEPHTQLHIVYSHYY